MTIIIRPSPSVFQGTTPLLIVFGAFQKFDSQHLVEIAEADGLKALVSKARRYRVAVGFSRRVSAEGTSPSGAWLSGCRPRVRDMVFDHGEDSCFSNPEFERVLSNHKENGIYFAGPLVDSAIGATMSGAETLNLPIARIGLGETLQKCSAMHPTNAASVFFPSVTKRDLMVPMSSWVRSLRNVEDAE